MSKGQLSKLLVFVAIVAAAAFLAWRSRQLHPLQVGDRAPDFTLPAPDGKPVKLTDLLGKGPVVIFTFIQAFTGV